MNDNMRNRTFNDFVFDFKEKFNVIFSIFSNKKSKVSAVDLIKNVNDSEFQFENIASDRKDDVFNELADNPNTPSIVLLNMFRQAKSFRVREKIVLHRNSNFEIVRMGFEDPNPKVREATLFNPLVTETQMYDCLNKDSSVTVRRTAKSIIKDFSDRHVFDPNFLM